MNYSEFKRLLGADPRNQDPAFLRARESSAEFREAAAEADRFEGLLDRALSVPAPDGMMDHIRAIPEADATPAFGRRFHPMAMAASLLIAVGAAGLVWQLNHSWDSVEDYVSDHYRHDGADVLAMADGRVTKDVQSLLAKLDVEALPVLAEIVGVIKYCPTPDGKGVHMVLNSERGLITVIYMPDTPVADRERITFDDREALLVDLKLGSAVIIGRPDQQISDYYALIQDSIVPIPGTS